MSMFDHREYVSAVYKEKSFSEAARKMYVTQPCLSAMVKKVEDNLGVKLFDRKRKPLGLTEYGERYIEAVEQVIRLEQEFDLYLTDVRGLKTGSVTIGANSISASYVLPDVIHEFLAEHPQIDIAVHEGTIESLEERLADGRFDLVLDNYRVDTKTQVIVPLIKERLYIAVPDEYRDRLPREYRGKGLRARDIAGGSAQAESLPFAAFKELPFLILRKGHDTRRRFDWLCEEAGERPEIVMSMDQLLSTYAACSDGIGAAIVSDTLIRQNPFSEKLYYYQVRSKYVTRELFFHYPKSRHARVAVTEFMRKAQEIARKNGRA